MVAAGAVGLYLREHLVRSDFHIVVFATVALDVKCFSPIQAQPHERARASERSREREEVEQRLFTRLCTTSEIGH